MDLNCGDISELKNIYYNIYSKEHLNMSLEKILKQRNSNFSEENKELISRYFINEFKLLGFKSYLEDEIKNKLSKDFTQSTKDYLLNSFNNCKILSLSTKDQMNIFSRNDLENQRNKNKLYTDVFNNSSIDVSERPLILILNKMKRYTSNDSNILSFVGNKEFLVYQSNPFFKNFTNLTTYQDKASFLEDSREMIQELKPEGNTRFFNIALLTLSDSKTTQTPSVSEFRKAS